MKNLNFAINIKAVLEDNSEVADVKGFIINDKRVYKLSDNTILTGTKKIKTFQYVLYTVRAEFLPYIMSKEYV